MISKIAWKNTWFKPLKYFFKHYIVNGIGFNYIDIDPASKTV